LSNLTLSIRGTSVPHPLAMNALRTSLFAACIGLSVFAHAADVKVYATAPAGLPAAKAGDGAQGYLEKLAAMIELGIAQKCGTDLVGQMVVAVPVLAASGTAAQRAPREAWLKKTFQRIRTVGDPSKLARTSSSVQCASLGKRFDELVSEPEFARLVQEGFLAAQSAEGAQPAR
jgi:hypothetical protein